MTSAGDSYTYERSLNNQRDKTPYSAKKIMYAVDTNSSQYTNQIQFDLSSFANVTDGFLNLAEASIQIPVVITASVPTGVAGPVSLDNFVGFKNGSWNIINSIAVDYDGVQVVAPNNFTNAFINYKVLSSWSADDERNFGPSCLFSKDSSNSWIYNNVDVATPGTADSRIVNGNGICNNQLLPNYTNIIAQNCLSPNVGEYDFYGNKGLLERMQMINSKPGDAVASATSGQTQNLSAIRNENNFRSELKNYTRVAGSGTAAFYQQWYVLCTIPLKHISNFFENLPLVKGAYLKMNITTNTGSVVVNCPGTTAARVAASSGMYCNASDINFQYTCPVMVAERTPFGAGGVAMAGGKYLISVGIVDAPSTTANGFTTHKTGSVAHQLTSCRVTLPICQLKPEDAIVYQSASLNKRVEWTDNYQTQILNVQPAGNFNSLISNGASDALGVLIIPLISATVNGNLVKATDTVANLANSTFSPSISPFATEPATSSPLSITQLQVMHGSENILSPFISYTYEEWLYQSNEMFKINGNLSTGLSSGLYSQKDFEDGLRYYWCSLSRSKDGEQSMPKSITISGINNSQVAADYLVFVVSAKSMNVNCSTGKVIKS